MTRLFAPFGLAAGLMCISLLAACVAAGGASQSRTVAGGEFQAAVPAGFCILPEASLESEAGSVLIAGRCNPNAAAPALLTLSVGAAGSSEALQPGAKALSEWFLSRPGRAALARDGRANSVRILQVVVVDEVVLLHLNDQAIGDYWRAVIGLRGRLVTVSVAGPKGNPLDPALSRKLVEQTITVLRSKNSVTKS